jgi:hypothetical protein
MDRADRSWIFDALMEGAMTTPGWIPSRLSTRARLLGVIGRSPQTFDPPA